MAARTSPYIEKAYERLEYISADEIKQLEYEAREQGAKALIETSQMASFSKETTLDLLIQKLDLSPEKAEAYLEEYWAK